MIGDTNVALLEGVWPETQVPSFCFEDVECIYLDGPLLTVYLEEGGKMEIQYPTSKSAADANYRLAFLWNRWMRTQ